jgi:hypothetical protein
MCSWQGHFGQLMLALLSKVEAGPIRLCADVGLLPRVASLSLVVGRAHWSVRKVPNLVMGPLVREWHTCN